MPDMDAKPDWTVKTAFAFLLTKIEDQNTRFKEAIEAVRETITALGKRNDERFSYHEKAVDVAIQAAEKAVSKAEMATEKRLENMNEFRQQLIDQNSTFVTMPEYKAGHNALIERLVKVENVQSESSGLKKGKEGVNQNVMWAIGLIVAIGLGIASLLLRHG